MREDILRITEDDHTWFGADHHFGHANIISYCRRPWGDVEEMNRGLIEKHNALVEPEDMFIHLGDLSLSPRWLDQAAQLAGRKYLVPGNHDKCWARHSKAPRERDLAAYADAGFTVLAEETLLIMPDERQVLACHLPYFGDHTETDRYAHARPFNEGLPLICGHVHDAWKWYDRMFNVGVDVNHWAPVPLEAVRAWLAALDTVGPAPASPVPQSPRPSASG
jgi:calcineurin-like phosphoesterase family protein